MIKLLTLTSKQAFLALFRFGKLPMHKDYYIEYKSLDDLTGNQDQIKKLFYPYPGIEFEDDYLFLCWELSNKPLNWEDVDIKDLKKIIPLTNGARKSLELKMDERIHFEEPIFEDFLNEHLFDLRFDDSRNGGSALLKYFGLSSYYDQVFKTNDLKLALKYRIEGCKSFEIENNNFLSALITYDRYESFPKFSALGFIYDTLKLLADWKGHTINHGEKAYRESKTYKFLEERRDELENLKTVDLLEYIDSFPREPLSKYKSHLSDGDLKLWSLAYFFFHFKEDFRNSGQLTQANLPAKIDHIVEHGKYLKELAQSVHLLGFFFGHSKIYSEYYDFKKPPFFKEKESRIKSESELKNTFDQSIQEEEIDTSAGTQPRIREQSSLSNTDGNKEHTQPSKQRVKEPTFFDSESLQSGKIKQDPLDSIKEILVGNDNKMNFNQVKDELEKQGIRIDGNKPFKNNIRPIIKDSEIQIRGSGSNEELYI